MINMLLVALGGALGSVLRYTIGLLSVRAFGTSFPWGTLFVNVTGSLLIGVLSELIAARFGGSTALRLVLITGILGGYTTFSAFSLDAALLADGGRPATAGAYIVASLVLSGFAVFAGQMLGRSLA